jgi:hypothetical protein
VPILLQPLRIPAGWQIAWNSLFEVDPTETTVQQGCFGGSSLFTATHAKRRFCIDVEWRPEDDMEGCYRLTVFYAPWERSAGGRRQREGSLAWTGGEVVHTHETPMRIELVHELEAWRARCSTWVREPA